MNWLIGLCITSLVLTACAVDLSCPETRAVRTCRFSNVCSTTSDCSQRRGRTLCCPNLCGSRSTCQEPVHPACQNTTCGEGERCAVVRSCGCGIGSTCNACQTRYLPRCVPATASCVRSLCRNTCPNSRVFDASGCPTCDCIPDILLPEGPPGCPGDLGCQEGITVRCPRYGVARGEDGCPLCACNPTPSYCQGVECPQGQICRFAESEVCSTTCFKRYRAECVTQIDINRCRRVFDCPLFCEHGFVSNLDGCPVCRCNPPPEQE